MTRLSPADSPALADLATPGEDAAIDVFKTGSGPRASLDVDASFSAIVEAADELTGADSTAILLQDQDDPLIHAGRVPEAVNPVETSRRKELLRWLVSHIRRVSSYTLMPPRATAGQ